MAYIAGGYTATLNSLAMGTVDDGYEIEIVQGGDPIRGDNLGDSTIDGIYRGGDCFINCVMKEFNSNASLQAWFPYATGNVGAMGQIGALWSAYMTTLVLTKVSGSNAVYSSLTALGCLLAPNYPIKWLMANRERKVPLRLQLFPYVASSITRWFSTT